MLMWIVIIAMCVVMYRIAETENTTWTRRGHSHRRITRRFSKRSFRTCQRQPDDVHHSQLGGLDDVGGKIFESNTRGPCSQLARKWQLHGTTVQLSIRDCHVRNENTSLVHRYQPH